MTINLASVFMLRVVVPLAVLLAVLLGLAADPFFIAELEGVVERRYFLSFMTVDISAVRLRSFLAVLSGDADMLVLLAPPPKNPEFPLTVSRGDG